MEEVNLEIGEVYGWSQREGEKVLYIGISERDTKHRHVIIWGGDVGNGLEVFAYTFSTYLLKNRIIDPRGPITTRKLSGREQRYLEGRLKQKGILK